MVNFYRDSHGVSWGVMMQERFMSCGPACVAMTKVYYTASITGDLEAEARRISADMPGGYDEHAGTTAANLAQVLRAEGVVCDDAQFVANPGDYLSIRASEATPVIAHVAWDGGGGHFVVCASVYANNGLGVFLDPAYGLVEVRAKAMPAYRVPDRVFTNFPAQALGRLSGWLVMTRRAHPGVRN